MKVTKTKKTCLVRKSVQPAFNQSFDFQLEESCINAYTITLELRQQRAFAVKGKDELQSNFTNKGYREVSCPIDTLIHIGHNGTNTAY